MANAALFVGWGTAIAGREQQALQVFSETLQYYGQLQQRGEIDSFAPFFLEPHGGDLLGFILIRGEREQLDRLRSDREFIRRTVRAQLIVQRAGVVAAYGGDELTALVGDYQQQLAELT